MYGGAAPARLARASCDTFRPGIPVHRRLYLAHKLVNTSPGLLASACAPGIQDGNFAYGLRKYRSGSDMLKRPAGTLTTTHA